MLNSCWIKSNFWLKFAELEGNFLDNVSICVHLVFAYVLLVIKEIIIIFLLKINSFSHSDPCLHSQLAFQTFHWSPFNSQCKQYSQYIYIFSFGSFLCAFPLNWNFVSHILHLLCFFFLVTSPRTWSEFKNICCWHAMFPWCIFCKWYPCNVLWGSRR